VRERVSGERKVKSKKGEGSHPWNSRKKKRNTKGEERGEK